MRGVCSECGLGFEWGEVLNPARNVPKWSVEHQQRFTLRRAAHTLVRSFWPWRFWQAVRIEQPIRAGPLALFAMGTLLLMHAGIGLVTAGATYIGTVGFNRSGFVPSAAGDAAWMLLWPYSKVTIGTSSSDTGWLLLLWLFAIALAMPLAFLALPQSFARARVRRLHLVRAFVLTLPIVAMGGLVALSSLVALMAGWSRYPMVYAGALLACGIIHTASWWVIVRRYLQLEHALAVLVAMTIIAWLAGFTFLVVVGQAA